jgi:glycosyltransferase involved in cell wall biosynthesis
MNSLSTVWLDVTDMEQWGGHMTGVQRVIYENMCRLQADPTITAKGFSYDSYRNEVFCVELESVIARISEVTSAPIGPDRTVRLKHLVRSVYFKTPAAVRNRITPRQKQFAIKSAKKALLTARHGLHTVRTLRARVAPNTSAERIPAIFTTDDTVLVLGKIWDQPALVNLLAARKRIIGFRYVQLVHDAIPVVQPQLFGPGLFEPYAQYLFETLGSVDIVLCNSKSTERDMHKLARELHFPKPHTHVVELGDSGRQDIPAVRPSFVREDEAFLLTVSTIEARKNHQLLYQTWKLAREQGITLPRMIVVGSPGWLTENMVYTAQHDPETRDVITFHHGVPDTHVKWLYEHCLFTVYPSIYEGWGIPIAESLSGGKVCIPSNAASLPEIAGDLLDYTSPFDPVQFLGLVRKYLDPTRRASKEREIAKRFKPRSWDDTYAEVRRHLNK